MEKKLKDIWKGFRSELKSGRRMYYFLFLFWCMRFFYSIKDLLVVFMATNNIKQSLSAVGVIRLTYPAFWVVAITLLILLDFKRQLESEAKKKEES